MKIGIDASNLSSGGGITHLKNFIENASLFKENFESIHIWTSKDTIKILPDEKWLKKHNPQILNQNIFLRSLWQIFLSKKDFEKADIDILFVPGGNYLGLYRPFVTMFRNLLPFSPNIISEYKSFIKRIKFRILKISQLKTFRSSQGLIFLTNFAKDHISSSLNLDNLNTIIIPHGTTNHFQKSNLLGKKNKKEDYLKLVYVSQFDVYKNQTFVLKALNKLCKNRKDIKIEINFVGKKDFQEYPKFRKSIGDLDNLSVKVHGLENSEKVIELIQKYDIGIFASTCENLPNTLIEYMSVGLPIISSNFGPMPEILKDAGLYFNVSDQNSFIKSLEEMIYSQSLRDDLSKKALEYSKQSSWEECTSDTINFLKKIWKDFERV